jgi:putative nucleotidyltransferase with HDIG domain
MMGNWGHLARRFVGAHRPGGPPAAEQDWVAGVLTPAEFTLWERQPGQDRRHTVEVARRVEAMLAGTPHAGDTRWLACALLHDIGKVAAGLGIYGRVLATLVAKATRGRATAWEELRGRKRRIALYLRHGEIGADMLRMAGGREEVAVWAAAHHDRSALDPMALPGPVVMALAEADPC